MQADPLLRTKLMPPRLHRRVLPRPSLVSRLQEALEYPLTVVQAGPGFGKTTLLADFGARLATDGCPGPRPTGSQSSKSALPRPMDCRLAWYSLDESDNDPRQFLSYLIGALSLALPDLPDTPTVVLQEISQGQQASRWTWALDALINTLAERLDGPTVLILDDYHFVADSSEVTTLTNRFIAHLPADLHVIITTRHPLNLPGMVTWRARNQVMELGSRELAFQPEEIAALFRDAYGMALSPAEIGALADKTEGWPIALQLIWQGLRSGAGMNIANLLNDREGIASLTALFDYLARDLLDRQPAEIADFMRQTAVLRELTPEACAAVLAGPAMSADLPARDDRRLTASELLRRLQELDLFIVTLGEGQYRYHHLFHAFLRSQALNDPAGVVQRHRRAAEHYQAHGLVEEAIYHWLEAADHAQAAAAIERVAEPLLRSGRLDTVANWIAALPADIVAERPLLQACLGDVNRLRSRFAEALGWYASAEQIWRARNDLPGISRALHGQAMVYLDTVRPAEAEKLLQEAVRLSERIPDRQARARLLDLLAENKLNTGKPAEAEQLHREARILREEGPT
ncbi:MAG: tetratricopeptide repeat protein, partial [Anaerolineae bacterium]|nr:tetratricopeptide repeat protein [Anaerolineae bacterium]